MLKGQTAIIIENKTKNWFYIYIIMGLQDIVYFQ